MSHKAQLHEGFSISNHSWNFLRLLDRIIGDGGIKVNIATLLFFVIHLPLCTMIRQTKKWSE